MKKTVYAILPPNYEYDDERYYRSGVSAPLHAYSTKELAKEALKKHAKNMLHREAYCFISELQENAQYDFPEATDADMEYIESLRDYIPEDLQSKYPNVYKKLLEIAEEGHEIAEMEIDQ